MRRFFIASAIVLSACGATTIDEPTTVPTPTTAPTSNPAPIRTSSRATVRPRATVTTHPTTTSTVPSVYYENCTAARAAGVAPIYRGQPGYRPPLDRDGDGIACE